MSRTTELAEIIECGVDLKNRILYFGTILGSESHAVSEVSQGSVDVAIRAIQTMALTAPNKPISIYMNSYGGDPYSALYLIDTILSCPCQFKFYGGGAVMSAAAYILASCDERYLLPNTTIMIHNGWLGDEGKADDVYISVDENKRLDELFIDILANNSFMPKQFWRDISKRDLYITAHEAVQIGIADEIVKPLKRGNFRKKRIAHLSQVPTSKQVASLVKKLYNRTGTNPKVREITIHSPTPDEASEEVRIEENQ